MKLTNDYRKLSQVLIFLIATLCMILCVGKLLQLERCPKLVSETNGADEFKKAFNDQDEIIAALTERVSNLEERVDALSSLFQESKDFRDTQTSTISDDILEPISERGMYISYVYEMSSRYYPEIKPEYVCAIVMHKSRFDPSAHNKSSDAQGLTQIRPKWHASRAERLGVTNLFDPYGNLLVCFDILSEQTKKHTFDYALNLFAGGYPYADRYRNVKSPFIQQLEEIINSEEFENSVFPVDIDVLLGGEANVTS